jgi:transposase
MQVADDPRTEVQMQPGRIVMKAEQEYLGAQLATAQTKVHQLQSSLEEVLAERVRLKAQLVEMQQQLEYLVNENQRLQEELNERKQAPFKPGRKRSSEEKLGSTETGEKRRGRAKGHTGSGRKRPQHIDHTERVEAGETCPDCGEAFCGKVVKRERTIEDIEPVRPTIVTRYIIERRWCTHCQQYKEAPVSAALPNCRLGLNVMLFVVYQKVALGLSYAKVQHELETYFGLRVSKGQLTWIVAEIARLFGPAYARLIRLMRQQAALHIDETGWRVDGHNHWLWVFVNDAVALYLISRSRGSKVPKALLGQSFQGVALAISSALTRPWMLKKPSVGHTSWQTPTI